MTAKEYTTNYITILDVNKEQDDQEEETNHIEPMATIKTADTLSSQFQTKEQNLRFFAGGGSIIIFISFILCLYWDEFATQTLTIPIEDYSDGCLCAGETIEIVCGWNGKSPSSDDLILKEIDKIFCDSCSSLSYNHTVFTAMVLLLIILSMTLVLIGGFMQCFGTHFEWLIKKACHYQKPCKWFSTIIYVISFIAALGLIVFMNSNEDCPVFHLIDGYRVGKSLTGAICATILLFIVIFIDASRKKYVG
eukprot:471061_1